MTSLPATLCTDVGLRRATADDVPALVALLTDDPLGRDRESPDLAPYRRAFAAVDADPAQLLLAVTHGPDVVGTAQLTEIPGLSRRGTTRLEIEAVRVRADLRGQGVGAALFGWVVAAGALLVGATSLVLADGDVAGSPLPQAASSAAASRRDGLTAARRVTR